MLTVPKASCCLPGVLQRTMNDGKPSLSPSAPEARNYQSQEFQTHIGWIGRVLETSRSSEATVWWAKRRDIDAYLVFIPGGRKCESGRSKDNCGDGQFPEVKVDAVEALDLPSATGVRRRFYASEYKAAFEAGLDNLIFNSELLCIYMGSDSRWVRVDIGRTR